MRVLRLLPFVVLFSIPLFAQTTTSAQGDPQAIAIVQAAITALGGATAIGQPQSWTLKAQMQGPHANGDVDYVISTDTDSGKFVANGTTQPAPLIHSHLIPALVGPILVKQFQDPEFSILYVGPSILDSKPITVIVFAIGPTRLPAQIWSFDATNLPIQVDFRLPAEIGARESFPVVVALSNYHSISGLLFPFQIISFLPGRPAEVVTVQSLNVSTTASPNEFNGSGGDLR
jgi:hypothetical protein